MLFNSFQFLLVFLPVALTIYAIADRFASSLRLIVLVILSGAFYAYWDWRFLPLLIGSVLINWMCARLFRRFEIGAILVAAMAANLAVLGWFKYEGFLVRSINGLVGTDLPVLELGLPLGISFFTFHHVMYLADVRAGRAPFYGMTRYALYIGFFPQVLAGPLVRWSEIMHQFGARAYAAGWENKAALGVILLVIGLAKKVWLGDPLGSVTNPVFESVASGASPGLLEAWQGALGFTFQIYFDFSGYTDMALGIALLFGIELPQNFDSPYKASSLQAFWRRWHMTLSRFLRDYLYIPLGGNRGGWRKQSFALFATMALGGLWHGAAWTFVLWGIVHGLGLAVCAVWRRIGRDVPTPLAWLATFLFVVFAWVLFRSAGFPQAITLYRGMTGMSGWGTSLDGTLIAAAAAIALLAPNSTWLAARLPRKPWAAFLAAVAFVALLLTIGDKESYEFIYFRF